MNQQLIFSILLLTALVCDALHLHPKPFKSKYLKELKTVSSITLSSLLLPQMVRAESKSVGDISVNYDDKPQLMKEVAIGKKAVLIVNVASQCALTPQYEELVSLREKYQKQGFEVLAFPSNQFANQEPAPVERIRKDMLDQFGVKFPIFDKIDVNGPTAHPLYKSMKEYDGLIVGSPDLKKVSWNFEKFLLDENLIPVRRYKPGIKPAAIDVDVAGLVLNGKIPARKKASLNDY